MYIFSVSIILLSKELSLVRKKMSQLDNLYKKYSEVSDDNPLYIAGAKRFVRGEGGDKSNVMFIGEAPGEEEENIGRPFVGRSGKLLRRTLADNNFSLENSFITNIVKFRPPHNRKPLLTEVYLSMPLIEEEISLVAPRLIVTVGATATGALLGEENLSITKIRGSQYEREKYIVYPILHPAFILRNSRFLEAFMYDLKNAKKLYDHLLSVN
jgi:DNA polymerase